RRAEATDLGLLAGGFDALREVAARDLARGVAHLVERPEPDLHDPARDDGQRGERRERDDDLDEHEPAQGRVAVVEGLGDPERPAAANLATLRAKARPVAGAPDGEGTVGDHGG